VIDSPAVRAERKACAQTLFVGEALVGNDAVDQLTQFNKCAPARQRAHAHSAALTGTPARARRRKLADLSETSEPRLIDGIILTKFDTIDDKVRAWGVGCALPVRKRGSHRPRGAQVGAAISMTYTTGQPIMFVGTGQDCEFVLRSHVLTATLRVAERGSACRAGRGARRPGSEADERQAAHQGASQVEPSARTPRPHPCCSSRRFSSRAIGSHHARCLLDTLRDVPMRPV
jgi:hypothetical protein